MHLVDCPPFFYKIENFCNILFVLLRILSFLIKLSTLSGTTFVLDGSTLKEKNLLPQGANSFLIE